MTANVYMSYSYIHTHYRATNKKKQRYYHRLQHLTLATALFVPQEIKRPKRLGIDLKTDSLS